MKCAGALAVKAEVLGEGLRDAHFEALLDEVADGPGIVFEVTRGEALIRAVEEGEVLAGADDFGELDPLVLRGIDAGGIVGAGVQEDDASFRSLLDGGAHAGEVEAFGFDGKVGVWFYGEVDVGEYLVVVGPCWGGEINRLAGGAGIEAGEEEGAKVDGAGAGDGLEAYDLGRRLLVRCEYLHWWSFTLFSLIAGLSDPSISFCAAEVKSARPAMGRYSWLRFGSFRSISSAYMLSV